MDYEAPGGGIEYSGPYHGIAAVGGRRVAGPRGYATTRPSWRHVARHHPASMTFGDRAGARLRRGHPRRPGPRDVFDGDTEWEADPAGVGLYVNHATLVGRGRIVRSDDGLWVNGVVYAGMRQPPPNWTSCPPGWCRWTPDVAGRHHPPRLRPGRGSVADQPAVLPRHPRRLRRPGGLAVGCGPAR